jgi:hypothetical protein
VLSFSELKTGKLGEEEVLGEDQESRIGCVKFGAPMRHPRVSSREL